LPAQRPGDPPVRTLRLRSRGLPQGPLQAWRERLRRRDPDGVRDSSLTRRSGTADELMLVARDLAVARGALAHLSLSGQRARGLPEQVDQPVEAGTLRT